MDSSPHEAYEDFESRDTSLESFVPPPLKPRLPDTAYYPLRSNNLQRREAMAWKPQRAASNAHGHPTIRYLQPYGNEDQEIYHHRIKNHDEHPMPPPYNMEIEQQIRAPRRSFRHSMRRLSLTPGEMPYPVGLLRPQEPEDYTRTEQMLGLRRASRPPPVPPKDPRWPSEKPILPMHRVELPASTLEPLNGRTAWLHAVTASLVVFNCWGMANAFGLFQAYYSRYRLPDMSPSAIAWIGSTQLALVFGLGLPVGRLVDRGYFRVMFHGGSVLMLLSLFCTAWCEKLWTLWLVQGLITGLGMGMVFTAGIIALMTWFDETKIGVAMGLGAAGSCIGGIVYILLARHFLATKGFATTMRILAGVATLTMIPPNLVFRMRGQKHKSTRFHRSTTGNNTNNPTTHQNLTLHDFTSPAYLLAASGLFFAFLGIYFGFVYIISFASTILHLSDTASTNLLILMLAANLPGRFLPALISDKCIGPLNTIIPSVFLSAAVIGLWTASSSTISTSTSTNPTSTSHHNKGNELSLTVIACFLGFVSAGVQVLYAPTVYTFCLEGPSPPLPFPPHRQPLSKNSKTRSETAECTKSTQLATNRMGVKAGGIFTCIGLACLISTPIGGALINYRMRRGLEQPYLGAQVFAGVSLLVGGSLLLASRVAKVGWEAARA